MAYQVKFDNGTTANFDQPPSQSDIEDAFNQTKGQSHSQQSVQSQQPDQPNILQSLGHAVAPLSTGISQALATLSPEYSQHVKATNNNHQLDLQLLQLAHAAKLNGNTAKANALLKQIGVDPSIQTPEQAATGGGKFQTTGQVVGDAAQTGLNLLSGGTLSGPGIPALEGTYGAIKGAQGLLSGGEVARGTGFAANAAKLAGHVGSNALVGGAQGAASAAGDGGNVLKGAGVGALAGGVAGGLLEGGSSTLKKVGGATAEGIYNQLFKTPVKQLAAGQEPIGSGLLKRGVSGGYGKIITTLQNVLEDHGQALDQVINNNANKKVDMSPVVDALKSLHSKLTNTPGESTSAVESVLNDFMHSRTGTMNDLTEGVGAKIPVNKDNLIVDLSNSGKGVPQRVPSSEGDVAGNIAKNSKTFTVPKELSVPEAQQLKKNLQDAVNNSFLNPNTTGATQAQKLAAQKLRVAIEQAVPEVAPINKELSFGTRAIQQIVKQSAGTDLTHQLKNIAELGTGIYGAYDTAKTGKVSPELKGLFLEKLLTNPTTASEAASALYKVTKTQAQPALTALLSRLAAKGATSLNQ